MRQRAPSGAQSVVAIGPSSLGIAKAMARHLDGPEPDARSGATRLELSALLDERALYRSWIARRPLCAGDPDAPDSVALFRAVRQIVVAGAPGTLPVP